ncbi:MAG TPA: GH92 family glycosyl hydrolase [Myxococcota bacterium]|nr:GH92 family glycosyl hydrolase [Myxococcota bacterium]HQK49582.1 GH92 family glycosyl hydrolase [Myxococcota bacterium]
MRPRWHTWQVIGWAMATCTLAACEPSDTTSSLDLGQDLPPEALGDLPGEGPADTAVEDVRSDGPGDLPDAPLGAVDRVNTRIGTGGRGWFAGSAFVGAQAPFGQVQAGPDGRDDYQLPPDHCSGFNSADHHILGFSHSHLHGTGIPDLAAVGFLPFRGEVDAGPALDEGQGFDADSLRGTAGHFQVTLSDGVHVELTATDLAAVHRYSWPSGNAPTALTLRIDVAHTLSTGRIQDGRLEVLEGAAGVRISAWNVGEFTRAEGPIPHYLAVRFRWPPDRFGTWKGQDRQPGVRVQEGPDTGAWFTWDLAAGEAVEVDVGLSFVDLDGAVDNLADLPDGGFDGALRQTREAWEAVLGRVRCEGGSPEDQEVLAIAIYHAHLMPNRFMDRDGRYRGLDGQVHGNPGFVHHTNFSLWDTYRGLHSLLVLLQPDRQADLVRSLVQMAREGGFLPKWPLGPYYTNVMIGSPADMVIAETWLKGIRDFDVDTAWQAMVAIANAPPPAGHPYAGRVGIEDYVRLGYVPVDRQNQSVARTLEFAVADAAMARLARALGKTDEAARYESRSANWRNLFDPAQGFFAPRKAAGTFVTITDPTDPMTFQNRPYTEGTPWQYLWLVPQDPEGLREVLGGAETMADRLETFFQQGRREHEEIFSQPNDDPLWWFGNHPRYYWHGNEPDLHAAFLFHAAGRPDRVGHWVHWAARTLYTTRDDGIPGNDDAGTMAAWYVFAALGFFPMPGDDRYWVGSPLFPRCEVDLPGDRTLTVEAPGAANGPAWSRVTWNGVEVAGGVLQHSDLVQGGTLRFEP